MLLYNGKFATKIVNGKQGSLFMTRILLQDDQDLKSCSV